MVEQANSAQASSAEQQTEAQANGVNVQAQVPYADQNKAMYILQITRSKLTEESMRMLKCLLLHILRTTELQHIVVEIYFDQNEFSPLSSHLSLILKALNTGYNLTEPEHSRSFPLVRIDIMVP